MKGKGRKGGQDKRSGDKGGRKGGKKGNYRGVKNNRRPSEPIKKKKDAQAGGKKTFCFNRYRDKQRVEEELKKKQMLEEKIEKEYQYSESDEEVNDPLQQLMSTFKNSKGSNKSRAVESSDESESEEEEMEADTNLAQDADELVERDSDEEIEDVSGDDAVEDEDMSDGSDLDAAEEEEPGEFNVSLQLETSGEEDEGTDNQVLTIQNYYFIKIFLNLVLSIIFFQFSTLICIKAFSFKCFMNILINYSIMHTYWYYRFLPARN